MTVELVFILAGGLAAGLISGLTGFGTALAASSFFLFVVSPAVAAPLILVASVVGQLSSLPAFWRQLDWKRTMPMVLAGIVGIPIGVWLLDHAPAQTVKIAVGILIVVYAAFGLLVRTPPLWPGARPAADGGIGFTSGILGGLIGLSGVLPVIWAQFRGWSPAVARSIYQPFNTVILAIALGAQMVAGFFTGPVVWYAIYMAPVTVAGAVIGVTVFHRISAETFRLVVLWFLLAAGIGLLLQSV